MIEVAIGEYGTDVLVESFDTTKIINTSGRNKCHTISEEDHEEIELEIGGFPFHFSILLYNTRLNIII